MNKKSRLIADLIRDDAGQRRAALDDDELRLWLGPATTHELLLLDSDPSFWADGNGNPL